MSSLRNSMKKAALHHSHSRKNGNPVFAPLIPANTLDARFRGHDGLSLRQMVRISNIQEGDLKVWPTVIALPGSRPIASMRKNMAEVPRTEPNGWRNLISTLGKNEKEMARLLDMSLLDELQREGFFDRIGR